MNPSASFTGAFSAKDGSFQFDASVQPGYTRYGSFRNPGQGANVSNIASGMVDLNFVGSAGALNINGEIAAWGMRGTPLSGGSPMSAYDFKLGLGAGISYQPGPSVLGLSVLASHETISNMGVSAPVVLQFVFTAGFAF